MANHEIEPSCYFCDEVESEEPEPMAHVTFRSGHEAFLCEPHFERAQKLDQLTEHRLVLTGIKRILDQYGRAA